MHPFSLSDEQVVEVSGGYLYPDGVGGSTPIPGVITWGLGETGGPQYPWHGEIAQ